ncbi:MAG: hypothetical protein EPO52_08030 [Herbiconiux sp.]|uniref:hypothetical protein n=1 Tax=Herbiconiux sp. TaxID=1871186 RepID=UPI001225D9D5|nr:hypothetical protein [Herbiconiux sp.]TAJ48115.1 MAG: hypothetical protein EPO52_08030 [Herbiconiux sp.]
MGFSRYRRSRPESADPVAPDPNDPYAAYLSWVAEGRPALAAAGVGSGVAVPLPEASTVRLADHVQVQQVGAAVSQPRPSAWQRVTGAFRRDH